MDGISGRQKRGALFRVFLPAVLLGAVLGVGGWTIASNWSAQAATRAPAAKARPAAGATKYDRVLGNIYYKVPPGYRAVQSKGGVYMARAAEIAAGNVTGALLITPGLPFNAALRADLKSEGKTKFVEAMALILAAAADDKNAKVSNPQSVNDAAKDGYEGYSVAVTTRDKDAGKTRYAQVIVTLSGDRIEGFMRIAYDEVGNLEPFTPGFQALASSIEFKNAGAPLPTRLAAALPTDLATLQAKAKAAPAQSASNSPGRPAPRGGGGNRSCQVQYRQQCNYIGSGAYSTYSCLQVPYTPPGCR